MNTRFVRLFLSYFLMIFVGQLWSMEGNGSTMLFDKRESSIVETIRGVKPNGTIKFQSPFFSSEPIKKALLDALKIGVKVLLHVTGRSNCGAALEKKGAQVKIVKDLHAKRILIQYSNEDKNIGSSDQKIVLGKRKHPENNDEDVSQTKIVITGSDNMTWASTAHKELMLMVSGDTNYYDQHVKSFDAIQNNTYTSNSPKKPILVTPVKPKVYGSKKHKLNEGKAERLKNAFKKAGSSIEVASMTFDTEDIVKAVEKGYEENKEIDSRFIFDKSALNHKDFLDRIKKAGGDRAKIYVYNEDGSKKVFGKFPTLQHQKSIIRYGPDQEPLVIISNGNLTKKSDKEINFDTFHPCEKKLYEQIKANNDKLIKECAEYISSNSDKDSDSDTE